MRDPKGRAIRALMLAVALCAVAPVQAQAQAGATPSQASLDPDAAFRAIYTAEWAWREQEFGNPGDEDGEPGVDLPRLPDVGPEAQQRRLAKWDAVLAQLRGIDPAVLSPAERVNYAVYLPQVEHLAASVRFRDYEMPFNSDSSFWANLAFMADADMRDAQAYRNYLGRLEDVPRYFDQQVANMRAGLARGFSVPRAVLPGRDQSIADVAALTRAEASPLWRPFERMPASIPAAEQAALRERARAAILQRVVPAHATLLAFFRDEYMPQARDSLAAEAMSLAEGWDSILRGEGGVEQFKAIAQATRDYLRTVPERTDTTREQLREIVMAQEFQDLTGQVLKRITDLANHLETQLLTLLVENSPAPIRRTDALGLLNGPAIGGSGVPDVVTNQAQVDELLESLGF